MGTPARERLRSGYRIHPHAAPVTDAPDDPSQFPPPLPAPTIAETPWQPLPRRGALLYAAGAGIGFAIPAGLALGLGGSTLLFGQPRIPLIIAAALAGLVLGEYRRLATRSERDPEPGSAPVPELTAREVEVLRLVATGQSYRDIAARLGVSHRTVQNHVQNTMRKLHLHNRVQLTRYALETGLEDPDR